MSRLRELLPDYTLYGGERVNRPAEYIAYLRTLTRFAHGELDNFPRYAVVLHDAKADEHLVRLGFYEDTYNELRTGTTDPNLLYVVRKPGFGCDFVLNRGMPGAGGIATQVAELCALGARFVVHIGTCGLFGPSLAVGQPIVARCAYKDGGAVMLSDPRDGQIDRMAYPDKELSSAIAASLAKAGSPASTAVGYTIPIFYLQPAGLVRAILDGSAFPGGVPIGYCEMEQSALFQTCALLGARAASIVVGSDRYVLSSAGELKHEDYDVDDDDVKSAIFRAVLDVFCEMERAGKPAPR